MERVFPVITFFLSTDSLSDGSQFDVCEGVSPNPGEKKAYYLSIMDLTEKPGGSLVQSPSEEMEITKDVKAQSVAEREHV